MESTSPKYGEKAGYHSAVCLEAGEVEWMEPAGNSNSETSATLPDRLRQRLSGALWSARPRNVCALAPGDSRRRPRPGSPGGRFWLPVRRHLQYRQSALGDVDMEALDVDVELRGVRPGRSLQRERQPGLDQLDLGRDAGRRGGDVDLAVDGQPDQAVDEPGRVSPEHRNEHRNVPGPGEGLDFLIRLHVGHGQDRHYEDALVEHLLDLIGMDPAGRLCTKNGN